MQKRILMSAGGVLLCGISVGMFKRASFGLDPFQALMSGINTVVPIHFGTLYVIVNACLLMFAFIFQRRYIGLGTLLNLGLLGYVADWTQTGIGMLTGGWGIAGRVLILLTAIVLNCLAAALYFSANLGVSSYDAIALIITYEWKMGQFRYNRIICDTCCVVLGALLCATAGATLNAILSAVGFGTIITMFFMGPLIDWFRRKVTDRMV